MSFFNNEKVRQLKDLIDIVIELKPPYSLERDDYIWQITIPLYRKVHKNISRYKDGTVLIRYSQEIIDFCFENRCSISEIHKSLARRYLSHNLHYYASEAISKMKNPTFGDLIRLIYPYNQLSYIVPKYEQESFSNEIKNHLDITLNNPKAYQEIFDNSFEEIKKFMVEKLNNVDTVIKIPQPLKHDMVMDEVKDCNYLLKQKFENNRVLANIKRNNHYLVPFINDTLTITNENKVIFNGLVESLSDGFTNKAIKINMDNKRALEQFKELLKNYNAIAKIENINHDNKIQLIKECIAFIEDTNLKYIPFKFLSKKLNMSKNQVKSLCKDLFGVQSIKLPKQFDNKSL